MKAALTLFAILLCPGWLLAQDATPGTPPNPSTQTTAPAPQDAAPAAQATPSAPPTGTASQGALQGCLTGSPSSGTYTITDRQSGTTYLLQGSADILRTLVGMEVEVSGQPGNASNSSGTATSGTNPSNQPAGMAAQTFQVTD